MKNERRFIAAAVLVMVFGLSACANEGKAKQDVPIQDEPIQIETEMLPSNEQGQTEKSAETVKSTESAEQENKQLEEELSRYRQEREDKIVEVGGLVEAGAPSEDDYTFDLSGTYYSGQFDTRELTEGYAAARIYVTDTLGIKPNTKMEVYMCVDPRVLEIYEDEDKGVAAGYDNSNIFICEYCNEENVWQYLILVREGKGSAWNVIHHGGSYKE